ncbi:MAG: LysM peptidoglycan-binding domain-containing protein [Defluviitaleaceae bacterium]|nr:LysM peptidoglycan-binding domain-containing protein [Defluviitaleaceae bacterium]
MSRKTFPPDKNLEDMMPDDIDYTEGPPDYYSEEMSRAAVGRLFVDDDAEVERKPPPVKSAFVTGFDRSNTTKRRPLELDNTKPPVQLLQGQGNEWAEEEEEHIEPPVERPRRQSATARLLGEDEDERPREPRSRSDRESRRRQNPTPKPAVRVNVPMERRPQEQEEDRQDSENLMDTFRRRYSSDELISLSRAQKQNNPPPRQERPERERPKRPERPEPRNSSNRGENRYDSRGDARVNRSRPSDRNAEAVSPMRLVFIGSAVVVLILIIILVVQLVSANGNISYAQERITSLETELTSNRAYSEDRIQGLESDIRELQLTVRERTDMLIAAGLDPYATPDDPNSTLPGETIPLPTFPTLPTQHQVVVRDTLNDIAMYYFGNRDPATLQHIMSVNNITNPNNIHLGAILQITPLPTED